MNSFSDRRENLEAKTKLPRSEWAGKLFGDRYLALRTLAVRRRVETLLANDVAASRRVVLDVMPVEFAPRDAQLRLEREAAALREAACPFLSPPQAFGLESGCWYQVQPFHAGVSLRALLRRGPLSMDDFLTVSACLLAALKETHARNILHGDLRPANVVVDSSSPLTKAVVMNVGTSLALSLPTPNESEALELALYQSPEQAGSLDHGVAAPSDLYSAGVVFYECLAGRPPFVGDSVGKLLFEHMTARPPELRSLGLDVPRALDELVQRLLRKDPRDRYQSAAAALMDLIDVRDALREGRGELARPVGLLDRRPTLTEPAFVGRCDELQQLDEQIRLTQSGRGGLVLLESESGGGKSRLLAETALRGAQKGLWIVRGQGREQIGQTPFQALGDVAAQVIEAARDNAELAEAIRGRLGEDCDAVIAAIPELKDVLGAHGGTLLGPEACGEARNIRALIGFLDALGAKDRPALIVLDDCQWADELTIKLIAQWLAQRNRGPQTDHYVSLIAAFRSEEVSVGHPLRTVVPTLRMKLPRFGPEDVRLLTESMAGPLPPEAVELVVKSSEGCPFMASAMLRGMVESGALVAESDGWRIEPLAIADLQSSNWSAGFLANRINLLPAATIDLLVAGAGVGKEFDPALAGEIIGSTASEAAALLNIACERHFTWLRPDGRRVAFVHDKIRSALLDRLSEESRRNLHRRIALLLEKTAPDGAFDLAYHFDAAGQSDRAMGYALRAARQARSQHSLDVAEQQYRIAERGAASADRAVRFEIAEGLGDVLMLRGRYDVASEWFEKAARLAETKLAQAQIKGKLGELAFKRGDMESATLAFEDALRRLGRTVPRRAAWFCVLLLWEVAVQTLHTLLPTLLVGRRSRSPSDDELLAVRLFSRLAHGCWYVRGRLQALWAHLRGLNLIERYPPTPELAQAYSEHAPGMSLIGYFRRGIAYAEKSYALRRSFGDLWGQGQSRNFHAILLYAASRYAECVEKSREAVRLLQRTGDYWELNMARYQMGASLYRLGNLRGALEVAELIHQSGLELGDEQASGISLDIWAFATGGRIPEGIL